jgi:glycosyltransferase involved in cell wall biosynthesis
MECAIITVYGYDSYTKSTDDYWGVRIKAVHGSSRKNIEMISHILTGDEFFCLYAHAHIFVFPSEYEAMSMALLEGLSFGIPTVYSNIPENEAVAHDLGYAFQVSDANSLADYSSGQMT